jgi:hypothetical protein
MIMQISPVGWRWCGPTIFFNSTTSTLRQAVSSLASMTRPKRLPLVAGRLDGRECLAILRKPAIEVFGKRGIHRLARYIIGYRLEQLLEVLDIHRHGSSNIRCTLAYQNSAA